LQYGPETQPLEPISFKECQILFRSRLTEPLAGLFSDLTGLRLHVLWHGPLDFQEPAAIAVLCPTALQRTEANSRLSTRCEFCLRHRWKPALFPANQGRRFIGQCGAANFCAGLQVSTLRPLTLALQAAVSPRTFSSHRIGQGRNTRLRARPEGAPVSSATFHSAVDLARLILHDLESIAQARIAASKLDDALQKLSYAGTEAARLRGELPHPPPGIPEYKVQPGSASHAQKLVEVMVDYVHRHSSRPIGLDEMASAMKMNASYLSALFAQTTGVTFHQFLQDVRLSKARELLRDPRNRVSEVARAAGYASPDAFRHAFKAHQGLSPAAWRAEQ
jgi:AraC-like DNA-binding protein